MDPNETLKKIRELIPQVRSSESTAPGDDLAEAVEALDDWLSHGGFLPKDWDCQEPGEDPKHR